MNSNQIYSTKKRVAPLLRSLFFPSLLLLVLLTNSTSGNLFTTQKAHAASTNSYTFLGNAYGHGSIQRTLLGPGQTASQQLFYLTYTYVNNTMDLVTVDPTTGQTHAYTSPVSSEQAAWALTTGPDNNVYIGTLPNAHLLQFNTKLQKLIDMGHVPTDPRTRQTQTYIWGLTSSSYNHTIYGCTYPSADLISYNPLSAHPQIVNLGSMDTSRQEQYAHTCVADPQPNAPYIYVGLGSVHNQIAVYNLATHTITTRINSATAGFGTVYKGADGVDYGSVMNGGTKNSYRLSYGQVTPTATPSYSVPPNELKDGGYINVSDTTTTINYPNGDQPTRTYAYTYKGKTLSIYRLGAGPDGQIYGGTALPYDLFSFDPNYTRAGVQMIGHVGNGQPYDLQSYQGQLYISAYAATPLSSYNPNQSFSQYNPRSVSTTVLPTDLRTRALTGAGNMLYAGAIASYGKLTGLLLAWNTQSGGGVRAYYPVANQSISSLVTSTRTCLGSRSTCLVGGTTIYGGTGTTPATTSARLFTWDTVNQRVLHAYALPSASPGDTIIAMINNPGNGYVYGIAASRRGNYLFVFDPGSGRFINPGHLLPLNVGVIYNSLSIYQGNLWGESSSGFFSINLNNVGQFTLHQSPVHLSAGFARLGNVLYGASNSGLWSYTI